MTRRTTLSIICDHCGRIAQHETLIQGFYEQIYCADPYPSDWQAVRRIDSSDLSPVQDYCPECKAKNAAGGRSQP